MHRRVCTFLFSLLILPCLLDAQGNIFQSFEDLKARKAREMQGLSGESQGMSNSLMQIAPYSGESQPAFAPLALDGPIDPESYVLGSGDELTIYLWGSIEKTITLTINSENVALIPLVGPVELKATTLADAKVKLGKAIRTAYKNVKISITLSSLRVFKVYVNGEVENPGSYVIKGMARVSDVILAAGGFTGNAQRRSVVIENQIFETRYADLPSYDNSNDFSTNPYLYEGDRLHVPPRKEYISVYGEVAYPREYDYVHGETLLSAITAAGGFTRSADSSRIIITRFLDDLDSLVKFTVRVPDEFAFKLKKDDRVLISAKPDYRVHRNVIIQGEVRYPGTYPIQRDKTKLLDVIELAGGLTEDAFLEGSSIIRSEFDDNTDHKLNKLLEIIKTTDVEPADIDPADISYIKSKLMEKKGLVSIDFKELVENGKMDVYNVILRENDRITIARKNLSVKVMGAVVSAGLVSYEQEAGIPYYVKMAGGFNRKARKHSILVQKAGTFNWIKPRNVTNIERGDVILVPERQYRDRFIFTKDVISIIAAAATIIATIVNLRN
ncbi:MAG: hypothetical protein GF398_09285 [Chitinivibrionales bacterium]|nr:hypothetical protein [Chitinivibrionales bacterium]